MADGEVRGGYLKARVNARDPAENWESDSGSTTTRGPIRPWGYRTPAEVFHGAMNAPGRNRR